MNMLTNKRERECSGTGTVRTATGGFVPQCAGQSCFASRSVLASSKAEGKHTHTHTHIETMTYTCIMSKITLSTLSTVDWCVFDKETEACCYLRRRFSDGELGFKKPGVARASGSVPLSLHLFLLLHLMHVAGTFHTQIIYSIMVAHTKKV